MSPRFCHKSNPPSDSKLRPSSFRCSITIALSALEVIYPVSVRTCRRHGHGRPGAARVLITERRSQRLPTLYRRGSNWSRVNKEREERLSAAMRRRWNARDAVEDLTNCRPRRGLGCHPGRPEPVGRVSRSTKRSILEWIHAAKTASHRARRVRQTAIESLSLRASVPTGGGSWERRGPARGEVACLIRRGSGPSGSGVERWQG